SPAQTKQNSAHLTVCIAASIAPQDGCEPPTILPRPALSPLPVAEGHHSSTWLPLGYPFKVPTRQLLSTQSLPNPKPHEVASSWGISDSVAAKRVPRVPASRVDSERKHFRDRPIQPLSHLSGRKFLTTYGCFRKDGRLACYGNRYGFMSSFDPLG